MIKKLQIYLILIFIIICMFGCSNNKNNSKQNIKILFTNSNMSDIFRAALASSMENYVKTQSNITIDILDCQGSIESQVNHIKKAVSKDYDAIICAAVDKDICRQLITLSNEIPIIFVNSKPDDKILEKDKYIYVGSKDDEVGQYQVEYALNNINKDNLKVVLFEGEKGYSAAIGRTSAVKNFFKKANANVEYVFEDKADWSKDKAKNMFNIFLKTKQDFNCVICNNDEMALGVIQACKENNIEPSSFLIIGVDATKDACNAILEGDMSFTIYQSSKWQGEYAVIAAALLASNKSLAEIEYLDKDGKNIWIPLEAVDRSNVSNYIN